MDVIKFSKDDVLNLYIKQVNAAIKNKNIVNGFINESLNYNNFGFSFSVFKNIVVKSVVTFYKTTDKYYVRLLFNNGNFNKEAAKNEIYQDIDENLSVKNNHLRYTYEVDYEVYKNNLNLFNIALKESLLSNDDSIVKNYNIIEHLFKEMQEKHNKEEGDILLQYIDNTIYVCEQDYNNLTILDKIVFNEL